MSQTMNSNEIFLRETSVSGGPTHQKPPEISFIHDQRFDDPESVHTILEAIIAPDEDVESSTIRNEDYSLPSRPILSRRTEELLFLRMNLLLCLADRRVKAGIKRSDSAVRRMLNEARSIRDHIVEANQRLVVTMSSKFKGNGVPLADLISEGNLTLLKAASLFDVSRGWRFSTYATHAILRNLSRYVKREHRRRENTADFFDLTYEDQTPEWLDIHPSTIVAEFLASLNARERSIVCERFGLTPSGQRQTLREIGRKQGISKERVRQIIANACAGGRKQFGRLLGLALSNP